MATSHINSFFNSVCYIYKSIAVDPGDVVADFAKIKVVLLTHGHYDHIYGLNELLKISPDIKIYTNEFGSKMLLDAKLNLSYYHDSPFLLDSPENIRVVADREILYFGEDLYAQAFFTPGHNPSCITWKINDMIFSGDALIPGIKTVTNLPGGNKEQSYLSEQFIYDLAKDNNTIFPGHICQH